MTDLGSCSVKNIASNDRFTNSNLCPSLYVSAAGMRSAVDQLQQQQETQTHQLQELYATVKRTPRVARSACSSGHECHSRDTNQEHVYQYPLTLVSSSPKRLASSGHLHPDSCFPPDVLSFGPSTQDHLKTPTSQSICSGGQLFVSEDGSRIAIDSSCHRVIARDALFARQES